MDQEVLRIVNERFACYDTPLRALWESLNNLPPADLDIILAMIYNSRCGLECRTTKAEGAMNSNAYLLYSFTLHEGATPLLLAAHAGRTDVIQALVRGGADIQAVESRYGLSALHLVVTSGAIDAIGFLVAHGANIELKDRLGCTPLFVAVQRNSVDAIKMLLELGANIGTLDNNHSTPLAKAVFCGHADAMRTLVEAGACVTHQAGDKSLLQYAAGFWEAPAIELLVQNGAEVDYALSQGLTPLLCLSKSHCETDLTPVKLLLAEGANIRAKTARLDTALHLATRDGNEQLVEYLLTKDIEINALNTRGETPLDSGSEWWPAISLLLVNHGAVHGPPKPLSRNLTCGGTISKVATGVLLAISAVLLAIAVRHFL